MKVNLKDALFSGLVAFIVTLLIQFLIPDSNTLVKPILTGLSVLIVLLVAKNLFPSK